MISVVWKPECNFLLDLASFFMSSNERKSWILDGFKTWYRRQSLKAAKSPVRKFVSFSLKVNLFILFIFSPSYHIPFLFLGQLFVISAVNVCLFKCIKGEKNMTWCPCSKSVAQYVLWFILIYESQLGQTLNREMIAQKSLVFELVFQRNLYVHIWSP